MKKLVMVFMVGAMLLTACGKEEPKVDQNTGKQQLVVAMDMNSAPYSYESATQSDDTVAYGKSGYAKGYDVWLARDLAADLKRELVIKKMDTKEFETALDEDRVDLVMGALFDNSEEDDLVYSDVYFESGICLLTRKDDKSSSYTKLAQFKKAKVASLGGTFFDSAIEQIKGVKHEDARDSYAQLIADLKAKKLDAFVAESKIAEQIVKQNSDLAIVSFAPKQGFQSGKGVVIGSDDEELMEKVNRFIKKQKAEVRSENMQKASAVVPSFVPEETNEK